ncbi:MAG: hypothetical protein K2P63_15985 [Lachnospiraceae bacterium]|nr:hypothetical protein [Lachnospiraceae bacterium]
MKRSQWMRAGIFLCALVTALTYLTRVFENKSPDAVSKEFAKNTDRKFDVIFLGPSTMKNDIYPLELYNHYGIAAYNLACGSQSVAESYYLAKSAIKKYQPDLLVLDVFMVPYEGDYLTEGQLHFVTDALRGADRWKIVKDLVPEGQREQYLFSLSVYHDRWKELEKTDFSTPKDITYGAKLNTVSKEIGDYTITTEKKQLPKKSEEYLRKLAELCQSQDVELLLVNLPVDFGAKHGVMGDMEKMQLYYNAVHDFAAAHQIQYWNYMNCTDKLGLDPKNNYDGGYHLNIRGAEKLTDFMGRYITEHYSLHDRRSDSGYDFIKEDYLLYEQYKEEQMMILNQ